jgi:hypothetical protein
VTDHTDANRRVKPGAEPTIDRLRLAQRRGDTIDSTLLARSDGTPIWQTEKTDSQDLPRWRPPFTAPFPALYRGFPIENLHDVLERGLDVPAHSAFFATVYPDKAWAYPAGRDLAAMLVLDFDQAEDSWTTKPASADDSWQPDKTKYPNEYVHGDKLIHTRFGGARWPFSFSHESSYGFWIPGDARSALVAVVLGGPQDTMRVLLESLQGRGTYGLELL